MLKQETIEELKNVFDEAVQDDLQDLKILESSNVEVINLDLVRVHINARGSRCYVEKIFEILKNNQEPGPLRIHEEAATSCNLLWYIDIINDI